MRNALERVAYVGSVERYSLKYVNLLKPSPGPLDRLRITLDVGGYPMREAGFKLRFETLKEPYLSVIECTSGATVTVGSTTMPGVLFTIDTMDSTNVKDFWRNTESHLDAVHDVLEQLFLNLVAPKTLEEFGPIWE